MERSREETGSQHLKAVLLSKVRENLQESLDRQGEELEMLQATNSELVKQHDSDAWSYKWLAEKFKEIFQSLRRGRESLKATKKRVKELESKKARANASLH